MAMVEMLREIRRHMIRKLSYLSEGVYYVSPDELGETQYKKSDMHSFPKDPFFLREKIHTLSDLILYVRTSFFRPQKGDLRVREGSMLWHFNKTGPETICDNKGNCGGISSMLNYLLKDRYDEVGFVAYADQYGGHVFNYIMQENCYYFVDLLNYLYGNRSADNLSTMIYQADSLKRYADYYREKSDQEIKIMVAYTADQVLPMGRSQGHPMMYFPAGSKLQVLHESPRERIVVQHKPVYHCPAPLNNCSMDARSDRAAECEG
jgi:hypothetical protein